MRISIEFDSVEEMEKELPRVAARLGTEVITKPAAVEEAKKEDLPPMGSAFAPAVEPKQPGPQPTAPPAYAFGKLPEGLASAFAPPPPPAPPDHPDQPTPPAPPIETVRAKLSEVNRLAGVNVADEIIRKTAGCQRLTEVPREKLADVLAAAEAWQAQRATA